MKRKNKDVQLKEKKSKILDNIVFEEEKVEEKKQPVQENVVETKEEKDFTQNEIQQLKETESLFKSSLFRLAFTEILKEVSVNWEKQKSIEIALHLLKELIEKSNSQVDFSNLNKLPKEFNQILKTKLKEKNFNFKIESISVVGSFILRSIAKPNTNVDVCLTMPKEMFQQGWEKTYFQKRASFLIQLSSIFQSSEMFKNLQILPFRGDHLKPILVIQPQKDEKKDSKFTKTDFKIRIIPMLPKEVLKKNLPDNILEDFYFKDHLIDIHEYMKYYPSFVEAAILIRVWLSQREMIEGYNTMNGFLFTYLMTYLLKNRVLNKHMSSFQIIRNTFHWISNLDISKGLSWNGKDVKNTSDKITFLDKNEYNIFHRITPISWKEFQLEVKTSLKHLDEEKKTNSIDYLFILKQNFYQKYDIHFELDVSKVSLPSSKEECEKLTLYNKIIDVLTKALQDRSTSVGIKYPIKDKLVVGIKFTSNWRNAVIKGPSPSEKDQKKEFEDFWGEKSQMRRFKDSSILLSTVWEYKNDNPIKMIHNIVSYVLSRHFKLENVKLIGEDFHKLLHIPSEDREEYESLLENAFNKVKKELFEVNTNLKVKEVLAISDEFKNTAVDPILLNTNILTNFEPKSHKIITDTRDIIPLKLIIEFYHDSRWPENLEAIDKVKQLQYIDYAEKLKLRTQANKNWLDIYCLGFVFRAVIRLPQENSTFMSSGLALNKKVVELTREQYKLPLHTRAISVFSSRNLAYSESVRLAKKWTRSHLFSEHIRDELIELIVAYTFILKQPSTPIVGFFQFISLLANHDWKNTPIYVNLNEGKERVVTHDEPGLFILESYNDSNQPIWTKKDEPQEMMWDRMVQYAKETEELLFDYFENQKTKCDIFFKTSKDYDVIIHLKKINFEKVMIGFDPVHHYLQALKDRFGNFGLFFRSFDENFISIVWNPLKFESTPFNISKNSWSMKPEKDQNVVPNLDEILIDIEEMGDGLIEKLIKK